MLTEDRLMEIFARRDRKFKERLRRTKLEDQSTKLVENVTKLAMEVKNIKENPPVAVPPDVVTEAELEKQRAHDSPLFLVSAEEFSKTVRRDVWI
jgi:methyl coenzyme M reductase subunit C-like uncharacterized protein (methanogenesis marker protein 7)